MMNATIAPTPATEESEQKNAVDRRGRLDILLPTIGSAGDVHPVLELGTALRKRGHSVTIITNAWFEQQVLDNGLGFVPMGTVEEAEATIADPRLWHPTKSFDCIVERVAVPNIARLYRIIEERRGPHTVVAASGLCFGARIAQEKLGVPTATVHLQPALLRSLVDGGRQGRMRVDDHVPRWIKRTFFWLVDKGLIDRLLAPPINSFRASLGLAPVTGILRSYVQSPQMVIGLFPDWFGAVQPDWPQNTLLTGFVLHDDRARHSITPEVGEFLASGPPPLVFTPGSAAATLGEFFRQSVDACRIGGFRAMLVTNYPDQLPPDLPSNVRAFSYLPFGEILPRCAALVYPGGIGTLAHAIHAGIPHFIVPHGHDQPDNAFRIERLGLGMSVYPEKYKALRVAESLTQLLGSSQIRSRCAEFARRIDSGEALERACTLLEKLGGSIAS
jgi:UDP:flavonoid glycosyltransferase YjiC (YdhE family)